MPALPDHGAEPVLTALRIAGVIVVAAAAFLGAYALGEADVDSGAVASAGVPRGESAPVSRAVPVPATARLPSLSAASATRTPRARRVARPAPATSAAAPPAAAPAPAPKPKPDTGTPFFDAE